MMYAKKPVFRVVIAVVLFLVIVVVYLTSTRRLTPWLVVFGPSDDVSVVEFWRRRGLETDMRKFIRPDLDGVRIDDIQAYRSNLIIIRRHPKEALRPQPVTVDFNSSDVLVVQHVQKSGGTNFENHIVLDLNVEPPCQCGPMPDTPKRLMCQCVNAHGQDWMFNRHNVGWPCGVHADFTELTSCLDAWFSSQPNENRTRRYHYVTMVRDPVERFMSEWLHVRRGATWKECRLHCDGRDATQDEVPFCFKGGTWTQATLDDFLNCSSNMAINRQTRMLANLSLSDCYRRESSMSRQEREDIMLQSAKDNLAYYFKFFGLLEYMEEGKQLFEQTFPGLQFKNNLDVKRQTAAMMFSMLSENIFNKIVERNLLDVQLYQYAKDLFLQRLKVAGIPVRPVKNEALIVQESFTAVTVET